MPYMPWIWLGVILIAIVVEALTLQLLSIWFVPAALAALVLSFFHVEIWIQVVIFLALSLVCLLFIKPVIKKLIDKKTVATNADAIIGENAVVVQKIDNMEATGQVKVKGQIWTARSESADTTYEVGEILHVVSIEGVKLICKK